jgi:hypothetical protein
VNTNIHFPFHDQSWEDKMNALEQLACLLSTNVSFRQSFLVNPEAALTAHGLALDAETKAALPHVHRLLAASPQELVAQVHVNGPNDWGVFALDKAVKAPTPL